MARNDSYLNLDNYMLHLDSMPVCLPSLDHERSGSNGELVEWWHRRRDLVN